MNRYRRQWPIAAALIGATLPCIGIADDGQTVFAEWCAPCHMDSPFAPGTIQLRQMRGADQAVLERRTDLDAEIIRALVRQGLAGMPKFRRTEINDAELDALVDYLTAPKS
jgi:mono/diheme cytochrome c family protein